MNSQTRRMIPVVNVPYINVNQGSNGASGANLLNKVFNKKNVRTVTNQLIPIDNNFKYVCFLFLF